jgi:hypothetical protein
VNKVFSFYGRTEKRKKERKFPVKRLCQEKGRTEKQVPTISSKKKKTSTNHQLRASERSSAGGPEMGHRETAKLRVCM